jgi:hypothetical protein
MKFATVFNRLGKQILRNRDGEPVVFPVFRWWIKIQDENGWVIHLLAFCSATTEDYRFQMFQGVIAFGWANGPILQFSPAIGVFHLLGKG